MAPKFPAAMITGITGSGGSYLAEHIVRHHPTVAVSGTARWHSTTSQENLSEISERVTVLECDMTDLSSVVRVIEECRPSVIFHLASHANVKAGFTTPLSVLNNNIMGTANLLEGLRLTGLDPVVQLCSTSEVYGQVRTEDVPIDEECPLRPTSPYAVSKTAQDLLGYSYYLSYGLRIIRTRMFSYLNPRRTDLFATSFARQVARIELGLQDELIHGNLDSIRTLIDVRDAMSAYWEAAEHCEPGEAYNIGGVTTTTVGDFLDLLKELSNTTINSRSDPSLLRPADVTLQIPCVDKFTRATGWKPQYSFSDSVAHLLEYWRRMATIEAREGGVR